jgi:hypothetical protein
VEAFQAGVAADLEAVEAFRAAHGSAVLVDAFEAKWPTGTRAEPVATVLDGPTKALGLAGLSAVYEVPPTAPASLLTQMRGGAAGVKLRCGGLEAVAFPTSEQVARVIATCRDNGLSLKFTAGLHHPIRHFDPGVRTKMHGFLNVFGAGVLAHARRLTEDQVREIVEDEDATHFAFDEAGFGWKQWRATSEEVAAARSRFVLSFGSCSFDEPRDDLRALGILT